MYFSKFDRNMVDIRLQTKRKLEHSIFRKQKDERVVLRQLELLQTY